MPPRDRKIIQRAMKREGCPGRTPDNRYEIYPWQEFINAHFANHNTDNQPDKLKLQNEKLEIEIKRLKFDLQVKQREYSANVDIELWVGDMVMQAKRVLLAIPSKLAPLVIAMTEVEAEACMKTEINVALAQLTSRPLHGDRYEAVPPVAPVVEPVSVYASEIATPAPALTS